MKVHNAWITLDKDKAVLEGKISRKPCRKALKTACLIVLAAALTLTLAACGDAPEPTASVDSKVTYFDGETATEIRKEDVTAAVTAGRIAIRDEQVSATDATVDVTLTMPSALLTETLGEDFCVREVGVRYIRYTCGNAYLYYTNDDRDNGLAAVVYYGTAYGFEPGETRKQDVLAVMGDAAVDARANDDAVMMFLHYDANATYLDYACGSNHVSFFFDQNQRLTTLALYQDGLWIY